MDGIPIRNLYLLLCYALEQPPEAQEAWKHGEMGGGYIGLLARLLVNRTRHILHRGVDRSHIPQRDLLGVVRGRIDLASTIRGLEHKKAKLWCEFEDHLPDVLHNQILKATLHGLVREERIPSNLRQAIPSLLRRLSGISNVDLRSGLFRQVQLGRQNSHYRLPMALCEFMFLAQLPDDQEGISRFMDYLRESFGMAKVFEDFVRNFLRFHGPERQLRVLDRRGIPWTIDPDPDWEGCHRSEYIPTMEADVLVDAPNRLIVLDAKFYEKTVQSKFGGSPKLYSGNLYQIQAYVEALSQSGLFGHDRPIEGMLIYPTTDKTPPVSYKLRGHRYHIRTLDLNAPWEQVHDELLGFTTEMICPGVPS